MRKIEFRGKKLKESEWVYGSFINNCQSDFDCYIQTDSGDHIVIDYKTVSQYTGLKDKNGKEIYEGDILKTFDWKIDKIYYEGTEHEAATQKKVDAYVVVKWSESNACFRMSTSTVVPMSFAHEVVGNIYENPELLDEVYKDSPLRR